MKKLAVLFLVFLFFGLAQAKTVSNPFWQVTADDQVSCLPGAWCNSYITITNLQDVSASLATPYVTFDKENLEQPDYFLVSSVNDISVDIPIVAEDVENSDFQTAQEVRSGVDASMRGTLVGRGMRANEVQEVFTENRREYIAPEKLFQTAIADSGGIQEVGSQELGKVILGGGEELPPVAEALSFAPYESKTIRMRYQLQNEKEATWSLSIGSGMDELLLDPTTVSGCSELNTGDEYNLTSDLYANAVGVGACINVTTSNVLLNCQGYKIINNASFAQTAIHLSSGLDNISVQNCEFDYFNISIENIGNTTNLTLTHLNMIGNSSNNASRNVNLFSITNGNFTDINASYFNVGFRLSVGNNITFSDIFFNHNIFFTPSATEGSGNSNSFDLTMLNTDNSVLKNILTNDSRFVLNSAGDDNIILTNITANVHSVDSIYDKQFGVPIVISSNWTMRNITISSEYGATYFLTATSIQGSHDIDSSNTINGKQMCYYRDTSNQVIDLSNCSWFAIYNSSNITARNGTDLFQAYVSTSQDVLIENSSLKNSEYSTYSTWSNNTHFKDIIIDESLNTILATNNYNVTAENYTITNQRGTVSDVFATNITLIQNIHVLNASSHSRDSQKLLQFDADATGAFNTTMRNIDVNGYNTATRLLSVQYANNSFFDNITISNSSVNANGSSSAALMQILAGSSNNLYYNLRFLNNTPLNGLYVTSVDSSSKLNNTFYNLTISGSDGASVTWGLINFTDFNSTDYLNISNVLINRSIVSANISLLNKMNVSAIITMASQVFGCSKNVVFVKSGFPQTSADIIANGSYFTNNITCLGSMVSFTVPSWSGYAITNDTTAPNVTILTPSNQTLLLGGVNFAMNFTATDNASLNTCWWSYDSLSSNTTVLCNNATSVSAFTSGTHVLYVFANDSVNNVGNASISLVFNTVYQGPGGGQTVYNYTIGSSNQTQNVTSQPQVQPPTQTPPQDIFTSIYPYLPGIALLILLAFIMLKVTRK